jgi:HlyD family secretion protein
VELARRENERPRVLSIEERSRIGTLGPDLATVWRAATTTPRDKKELLGTLIEEVIVRVERDKSAAYLTLRWKGGALTEIDLALPRKRQATVRTDEDTVALVRRLAVHYPDAVIAGILNRQGRRTAKGHRFEGNRVAHLRTYWKIPCFVPKADAAEGELLTIKRAAIALDQRYPVAATALTACQTVRDPSLIAASGHVEATDVRVGAKVPGRVATLRFQEGDSVGVGQVLAQIDTTDIGLALRQARAERAQAEAELRLRVAGPRKEDIAELEAQLGGAQADFEGAQKDLDRMQGLLDSGSGTTKSRDDARTHRDVLAARIKALRESLAKLRAGTRVEEIDSSRARLQAMEARIAQLEQQSSDATVLAPLAGVVTEKVAEVGELLQVGSPVVVITDLNEPWLTVYVAALDLPKLRLGQEADVVTDDGQTRKGKITFVASQAEFTPKNVQTRDERVKLVYKIKVLLPNDDGLFKPGMPAEARFRAEAK